MAEIENVNNLLEQVNLICQKYDAIAKITGDNFNIFQTLNLQSDELSHSKIIAELLNPKGSHGMEDEFLKLFLKKIVKISEETPELEDSEIQKRRNNRYQKLKDYIQNQELKNTRIKIEEVTKLGRADIVVTGNYEKIIIENKIYAGDQESQLKRYREAFGEEAAIIYLTLDGHPPSDYSTEGDKGGRPPSDYSTEGDKNTYDILMSYKDDIINWLERCKEKSVNFSYLRETIAQYINILNSLTGQSRRKDMSKEIVEAIVKSPENVKTAFAIDVNAIKRKIVLEWFVPKMKELATKKHNLTFYYTEKMDCLKSYWRLHLGNELLEKNGICVCFEFGRSNLNDLHYGFYIPANNEAEAKGIFDTENPLRNHIKARGLKNAYPWYLFCEKLYSQWGRNDWWRDELADLVSEESDVIKRCDEKIIELLGYLKDF
jgi:hypothetical protein